jgi:hypothetical protein
MTKKRYSWLYCALSVILLAGCKNAPEQTSSARLPPPTPDEARQSAVDAYVYGYPLVTMEMTRRVITNVGEPVGTKAPMGQLIRMRSYPDAKFRDVTAPNADTLYTTAFIDVSKEPFILSLPDSNGRYYMMPMLDGWTNVFQVPGTRTTGNGPGKYAITGPTWTGTLPDGVTEYKSPTAIVWILGRIYCTGTPEDYDATHAMQDQVTLVPLSAYGRPYTPPAGVVDPSIDMKTPVRDQVNGMTGADYFTLLARLMKDNPPAAEDASMVEKMARLGIFPGEDFDIRKLDPATADAINNAPKQGIEKIMDEFKEAGTHENGWAFTTQTGVYGTDYFNRALVTAIGLGANRPQDAVYPTSDADADGKPYDGGNKYVMHFDKGQMPPAKGFWSLTMYDGNYFFVDNPLNRYNVSSRSNFTTNVDGSTDVFIQHDSPGADKEANWLPAPVGKFILMLRLYWPQETPPSIIDGSWKIPPVTKAD